MDAVHKPSYRAWIDDAVINVRKFLEEWKDALPVDINEFAEDRALKSLLSEKEYLSVEKECGKDALKCQYQEKVEPATRIDIPEGVYLDTLRFQSEDLKKRENSFKYACAVHHSQKYCNYPLRKVLSLSSEEKIPFIPVTSPEVILTVQVFVPEKRTDSNALAQCRLPSFQCAQEFLVLGCQYLNELRDKIDCISDKAIPGDFSDCPTVKATITCKDLYKSGFFYINGVFYDDMRDKDCRANSMNLIEWAADRKRGIGPFKSARMEQTQFLDLNIQLGYPYVYNHQGECEHLLVFSDLRMFSQHDVQNKNAYPVYSQVKPSKRIFCMVCQTFSAVWVVYDNKRLPENPFFFCKTCFSNFNYDKNNQKIGEFRAYHFPDHSKLT